MTAKFTDKYLSNLAPEPPRYVWDSQLPAFGIYVGKRVKTFIIIRSDGKREKLGKYPILSLAQARRLAFERLNGIAKHTPIPLEDAVGRYLRLREPELAPGTLREYSRHLRAILSLREHVEDVTASQILDHLDTIDGQSDKAHAARALKTFFNWCVEREYCRQSPMQNLKLPKEPPARERVLSGEELCEVWHALATFKNTPAKRRFQHLLKLALLTGQRQNQLSNLKPDWVDFDNRTITFPASIMKARKPHTHYFSTGADFYLRLLTHQSKFTSWPVFMRQLRNQLTIPHFTPHDLRRTYATLSAEVGIPPHITERLLAHSQPEGHIASIYNRYRYEKHLREAAELIESHILTIVTGRSTLGKC